MAADPNQDLKIISWNILAPEALLYFFRSSYGIYVPNGLCAPDDKKYYDDLNKMRIDNIIAYLSNIDPDIICLQEITDTSYSYLNGLSIQQYIASALNYTIVSQTIKKSDFKYNYPPREQSPKTKMKVNSGVATLMKNNSNVKFIYNLYSSDLDTLTDIKSPFTLDLFQYNEKNVFINNVHIKMHYPHIHKSLDEVYTILSQNLSVDQIKNTISIGDFNASTLESAKDLFTSKFYDLMFNNYSHELIDDHAFIGNSLKNERVNISYDTNIKILEMNINSPASDRKIWNDPAKKYILSEHNNQLVDSKTITTDHSPVIVFLS